jgi:hypothetical protein
VYPLWTYNRVETQSTGYCREDQLDETCILFLNQQLDTWWHTQESLLATSVIHLAPCLQKAFNLHPSLRHYIRNRCTSFVFGHNKPNSKRIIENPALNGTYWQRFKFPHGQATLYKHGTRHILSSCSFVVVDVNSLQLNVWVSMVASIIVLFNITSSIAPTALYEKILKSSHRKHSESKFRVSILIISQTLASDSRRTCKVSLMMTNIVIQKQVR